jgi:hypothetical protein
LALDLISKDPVRYGIDFDPEPAVKVDTIKPGQAIDLRLVAETIDTDLETLRSLNPELLRLVTPPDPEFVLCLPEGTAERFFAEIAAIPPEKWVSCPPSPSSTVYLPRKWRMRTNWPPGPPLKKGRS